MYEEDKEILFGDHFDSEGESYFLSVDEAILHCLRTLL